MVIQRIQTLYLFVAAIMMGLFTFLPMGYIGETVVRPSGSPVFMILNLLIAVVLIVAIFLFKNLRLQRQVTLMSIVLIAVSAVCGGIIMYGGDTRVDRLEWVGGITLLVVSMLLDVLALRGINHDKALLSSSDRLR